jgi:hypothetical protein
MVTGAMTMSARPLLERGRMADQHYCLAFDRTDAAERIAVEGALATGGCGVPVVVAAVANGKTRLPPSDLSAAVSPSGR